MKLKLKQGGKYQELLRRYGIEVSSDSDLWVSADKIVLSDFRSKKPRKEKSITLPIEVMNALNDILWQDMNFHNPHEILVQARTLLLELGITLKVKI